MTATQSDKATRFRALHQAPGAFVMPNPWDAGSARVLAGLDFRALATSSGASAGILGRRDGRVTPRDLTATALHCLGYAPDAEVRDVQGRPHPASRGRVIRDIL